MMNSSRVNYRTIVLDRVAAASDLGIAGRREYSDWAVDEADLFRQYDKVFTSWKLVSKSEDGLTYTITFDKIR